MTVMRLVYCPTCGDAVATGESPIGLPADHTIGEVVHPCSVIEISPGDFRDAILETGSVYFARIDASYSPLYI